MNNIAKQKRKSPTALLRSPINCIREGTLYSKIFDVLYLHRKDGIGRPQLITEVQRATGRQKRLVAFGVSVVTSPTEDGSFHRSARRIADVCWFEKQNGWVRMRLRKGVLSEDRQQS